MMKISKGKKTVLMLFLLFIIEGGLVFGVFFQIYENLMDMPHGVGWNSTVIWIMDNSNLEILSNYKPTEKQVKEYVKNEYGVEPIVLNWTRGTNYNADGLLDGYYFQLYADGEIFWVGRNEYDSSEVNNKEWLYDFKKNKEFKDEMEKSLKQDFQEIGLREIKINYYWVDSILKNPTGILKNEQYLFEKFNMNSQIKKVSKEMSYTPKIGVEISYVGDETNLENLDWDTIYETYAKEFVVIELIGYNSENELKNDEKEGINCDYVYEISVDDTYENMDYNITIYKLENDEIISEESIDR